MSRELFDQHISLALRIASGIYRRLPKSVDHADIKAAAMFGLWEAALSGDGKERFENYASVRIRGAVIDELRRQDWSSRGMRRRGENVPLIRMGVDDSGILDAYSVQPNAFRAVETAELLERLATLPERERRIAELLLRGMTQLEISVDMGLSEPRVSQLLAQARNRLKLSESRKNHYLVSDRASKISARGRVWLARLWRLLTTGPWAIAISTSRMVVLKRTPYRKAISPRDASVLRSFLLIGSTKGSKFPNAAQIIKNTLLKLGAGERSSSAPFFLFVAARASANDHTTEIISKNTAEISVALEFDYFGFLSSLPKGLQTVGAGIVEGLPLNDIAKQCKRSRSTIALRAGDIYAAMKVSGAVEFRAKAASYVEAHA